MSARRWSGVANAFRRAALPLMSYYALTLGVPIANGAAVFDPAFMRHAALVLLVPLVAIVLAGLVFARGVRRQRSLGPASTQRSG